MHVFLAVGGSPTSISRLRAGGPDRRVPVLHRRGLQPGALGLLKARKHLGYDDKTDDTRTDAFDYHVRNDAVLLMVRLKQEVRQDNAGLEQARTEYLYDAMCTGGATLTRGHLCKKRVWRGSGQAWAEHSFSS